jgi:hypothetical protein
MPMRIARSSGNAMFAAASAKGKNIGIPKIGRR